MSRLNYRVENTYAPEDIFHLYGKHIFTESFGDGEISMITGKNANRDSFFVYFHSNLHGEIKLEDHEFIASIQEVKDIPGD